MQPGKLRGLNRLADETGHLCMLAIDQRPPLLDLVRQRASRDVVGDVVALKTAVLTELQHHASAVLIDPWTALGNYQTIDPRRGLLLTLEHHCFDETPDGRRSRCIPDWSVDRIARAGADGVKLLAWYRPDADAKVSADQERFVEEVGAGCVDHDIPFVFELLLYPLATDDEQVVQDPDRRRRMVLESVERFTDPRFAIDVFKVESPFPAASLPEPEDDDGSHGATFAELDHLIDRPWVLLSGGHDRQSFGRALRYACDAGASGFLAGRSIWWDAVALHPDRSAVVDRLRDDAAPFLDELSELVRGRAPNWRRQARGLGGLAVDDAPIGGPPW
jgi:tagatose 1,6-diphosphate aldolase